MSQVPKFSGSFLLVMAVILLMGLSLETGLCQTFNSSTVDQESFLEIAEGIIPEESNIKYITSQDVQNIASFSNGPMGLWSGMNTSLMFGDDGALEKSRKTGMFSYGSDLMEINEFSWLTTEDELGNIYYSDGYEQSITLMNVSFPFAVIRDDLTKLSDTNFESVDSDSMTYLLLYDDFSTNYDLNALNMAFGNSSELVVKTFKYDPEVNNLSTNLGFDLSMYFSSEIWSQFGEIFNNKEIMAMFNKMAKDQLAAKDKPPADDDNPFGPGRNWWEDSEGGVYCKWGAVP